MKYDGGELALFAQAHRWKATLRRLIAPFLGDAVLEVGAGLGATTEALCGDAVRRWVCLEPDPAQTAEIAAKIACGTLPACCRAMTGVLANLPSEDLYDSLLYVDVLEHIADDKAELAGAAHHLAPQGFLVVVAPAHQWLMSPFDRSVGHFRRYSSASLRALTPPGLRLEHLYYIDSCGLLLSLGNRLLLREAMPSLAQILFWDRVVVPMSRLLDPLLGRRLGKTVIAVWRHP